MIENLKNEPNPKEKWFEHIVRWQTSGIKIGDYCRQHNLDHNSFIYWRKKFINDEQKKKFKPNPISFLQVGIKPAQEEKSSTLALDITIILGNKVKILVPANLPQQDLFQMIKMIKGLP